VAELIGLIRSLYPKPLSLEETLRVCDLEQVAARQTQRLSGGQRQRVRLALALAGNLSCCCWTSRPPCWTWGCRAFWACMGGVVAAGRTVLFATHRLEKAEAVAHRVLVIAGGRLLADGTLERKPRGHPRGDGGGVPATQLNANGHHTHVALDRHHREEDIMTAPAHSAHASPASTTRRRARATAVLTATLAPAAIWLVAVPLLGYELRAPQLGGPPAEVTLPLVIVGALTASLLGWGLLALPERRTRRARALWTVIAVAVLVVSFTPCSAPTSPPPPGSSWP